eukprot:Mrub_06158.p1 GENE.Mrub_06158~~Mrub_06158.p1  ORF type:complete len:320 (-),score=60.25 Mrub_06158:80-934(-)
MKYEKTIQSSFGIKKRDNEKKLDEENAKILNNILEISRRKSHFWMSDNDKYWSFPVSLNINVRKNKSEDIYRENKKIADSLAKTKASDYSVSKLKAQAEENERLKNMVSKKRKMMGIKSKMERISKGLSPIKFTKFQDIVNNAIDKIKYIKLKDIEKYGSSLTIDNAINYIRDDLDFDKKLSEFINELFIKGNIIENEISSENFLDIINRTQFCLELINMYQINNLKIENSVEKLPFVKAIQILFSMDEEIVSTQYWIELLSKSSDESTVDFRDICVWILVRQM